MLSLYVGFQVGRVSGSVLAVLALVGLLAGVDPHVLLQLRGVAEAFAALHANVRKVLAVDSQQVMTQQPLFCCLVVAEFALVHFVNSFVPVHHLVSK